MGADVAKVAPSVPSSSFLFSYVEVAGIDLAAATTQRLDQLVAWAPSAVETLPDEMLPMAHMIVTQLEPSIGLHPANIEGLVGVIRDLLDGGNSVVLVDHDVERVIATGTPQAVAETRASVTGVHLRTHLARKMA